MAEVFVAIPVEFVEMLDALAVIADSTSVIVPTARVPSTVTSELKLVASATVPPVNDSPPPRASPSHSRVPSLFVRAVPSIYKLFATEKSLSALTVPEV